MIQPKRMPVFMRGSRGMIQQVAQFEIARIAPEPVDRRYIVQRIFFDPEKIQSRVRVVPDGRGRQIRMISTFDVEPNRHPLPPDPYLATWFVPGPADVI